MAIKKAVYGEQAAQTELIQESREEKLNRLFLLNQEKIELQRQHEDAKYTVKDYADQIKTITEKIVSLTHQLSVKQTTFTVL